MELSSQRLPTACKLTCGGKTLGGRGPGLLRSLVDARDAFGDFARAACGLKHTAGDFHRRGALLLNRGGDACRRLVYQADRFGNTLDQLRGRLRRVLDRLDLRRDFL